MKAIQYCIVVITIAVFCISSSVFAEKEVLDVEIEGLNQAEVYIIKTAFANYGLPVSTPVKIEKSVFIADWNGKDKKFDRIKVTIETIDGEFIGKVDNREYPQLSGDEYYGLLDLALSHACQGPEAARRNVELEAAYSEIQLEIIERSREHGYEVLFHRSTESHAFFYIDDVWCGVSYSSESGVPVYSMVNKNRLLQVVDGGLDAIFASVSKK